jgi:predicted O-methyltransferase YrrM
MKSHTDLLNFLAEKIQAKTYLEIGVSNRANNFDKINVRYKVGVDPNPKALANFCGTSDEFFENYSRFFSLIFLDGLHHADQVQRDFENSLNCLYGVGYIVLHDTMPESEHLTHVPRDKKGRWLGDVYKFACKLNEYSNIDFQTVAFDNGCTVVRKTNDCMQREKLPEITWEYFDKHRNLLRLVSPEKFVQQFTPAVTY